MEPTRKDALAGIAVCSPMQDAILKGSITFKIGKKDREGDKVRRDVARRVENYTFKNIHNLDIRQPKGVGQQFVTLKGAHVSTECYKGNTSMCIDYELYLDKVYTNGEAIGLVVLLRRVETEFAAFLMHELRMYVHKDLEMLHYLHEPEEHFYVSSLMCKTVDTDSYTILMKQTKKNSAV